MDVPTMVKLNQLREDFYELRKEVRELHNKLDKLVVMLDKLSKPPKLVEPKIYPEAPKKFEYTSPRVEKKGKKDE